MRITAGGLVLVGLALLTSHRVPAWTSDATLWTETLRQLPENPRALINAHQVAVARLDVAAQDRLCGTLQDLQRGWGLSPEETWFTDRLCLSR